MATQGEFQVPTQHLFEFEVKGGKGGDIRIIIWTRQGQGIEDTRLRGIDTLTVGNLNAVLKCFLQVCL